MTKDSIIYFLLKILFIILISLFIFNLLGPQIISNPLRAKKYATKARIDMLETSLDLFRLDVGRYPSTKEGLGVLIFRPDDIDENIWKGPYLPKNKLPKDLWGNDYNYLFDANNDRVFIYSFGEDGISKSEGKDRDDINNWSETRGGKDYYNKRPIDKVFWGLIISILLNAFLLRRYKKRLIHNQEAQVDSQSTRV